MIKLEHVSKYYSTAGTVALGLHNVSVELNKGEIVAIVGESGSGKSTFLNVVSGIDSFEEGEVYFYGEPVSVFSQEDLEQYRKNHVGFIFQNYNLVDSYSVLKNVMLPLIIRGYSGIEAKKRAKEIIKRVGLEKRMHHRGTKLSGGEKQRTVIARALASNSDIIACDEPTGNLDSKTGAEIIELIKEVAKDKLVLIVTHNYEEVENIATRRLTFHDGELIEDTKLKEENIVEDEKGEVRKTTIKLKDKIKIAFQNIISTPKKTILSFLVLFCLVYFIGCIYCSVVHETKEKPYLGSSLYVNTSKDRMVIFDKDLKPLDMDLLRSTLPNENLILDSYFEDLPVVTTPTKCYLAANIDLNKIKIEGEKPKNSNEVILSSKKYNQDFIGQYLNLDYKIDGISDNKLKVVGLFTYIDKDCSNDFIAATPDTTNKIREAVLINNTGICLKENVGSSLLKPINIDDTLENNKIVISGLGFDSISSEIKDLYCFVKAKTYVENLDDYDVSFEETSTTGYSMNKYTLTKLATKNVYQVSYYQYDHSKIDSVKNKIERLGYDVAIPANYTPSIFDEYFFRNVLDKVGIIFLAIGAIFGSLCIYFFTYLILGRIFSTKTKDYTIIRTLGASKSEMSSIVVWENIILVLSSTLIVLIVEGIFLFMGKSFISSFQYLTFVPFVGFILIMVLFALLFANRFNHKLFKFSVQTTLKKEVTEND